jgi:hypothetical protein
MVSSNVPFGHMQFKKSTQPVACALSCEAQLDFIHETQLEPPCDMLSALAWHAVAFATSPPSALALDPVLLHAGVSARSPAANVFAKVHCRVIFMFGVPTTAAQPPHAGRGPPWSFREAASPGALTSRSCDANAPGMIAFHPEAPAEVERARDWYEE